MSDARLALENLANPWILARLALSVSSLSLALVAAAASTKILAIPVDAPPDARALRAERDAELASAGLGLASLLSVIGAVATVLAAHRLSPSVRGTMCAYGVFATSPLGPRALLASLVAALCGSVWLGVRAVDVRIARGSLSRTLARGAWVVCALVAIDAVSAGAFFLTMDLRAHGSCCSTGATYRASIDPASSAFASLASAPIAALVTLVAAAWVVSLRRRASASKAFVAALLGALASASSLVAMRDVVSPFAYGSPHHRCAYCLLRADELGPLGWTLMLAWAIAALSAARALGIAWVSRRQAARREAHAALSAAAPLWIAALVATLALGLWPIVRYRLESGTFALFGG
ncbi:MAG: hypothetical protein JNK05_17910 [Myxococcales bacterium]|nr:hypothetical protein [Myxococcales bacterium]